ncbi:hypothetical protein V6N11_070647 [Hibiscus sabdariffa]|uniref:Uncharacterized protein n=1 Tax=Hibiscus sabdariffa TaxID=183260 RepID=A0ABR2QFM4_9ROSI
MRAGDSILPSKHKTDFVLHNKYVSSTAIPQACNLSRQPFHVLNPAASWIDIYNKKVCRSHLPSDSQSCSTSASSLEAMLGNESAQQTFHTILSISLALACFGKQHSEIVFIRSFKPTVVQ